jgi:hypothetical protein
MRIILYYKEVVYCHTKSVSLSNAFSQYHINLLTSTDIPTINRAVEKASLNNVTGWS